MKDVNDYANLALHYKFTGVEDREIWNEIEKKIGDGFYKLSNTSLISLKYAFDDEPKFGSPRFHKIINDLLISEI